MLELLFLLLPIAAAYGWYMGSRSARQKYQATSNRLSREYVDGLNFLLTNQRDKALDHFLDLLKEESGTLEVHLTLGNLFRSQGEVNRAIRIHQMLMENESLTFEQRLLAAQQLGRDYLAAGFYDRAEERFKQLVDEPEFAINALQQLTIIYQSTSDWQKAINVAMRLVKLGRHEYNEHIGQFYCELAAQEIKHSVYKKASSFLHKALAANKDCARASLMLGQISMAMGDMETAISKLTQIVDQDKTLIGEAMPYLKRCYQQVDRGEEFKLFLEHCADSDPGNTATLMLAEIINEQSGLDAAQHYVHRALLRQPNLKGFYRLMEYHLAEAEEGRAKDSLILLRKIVGEQIKSSPNYRCERCGLTVNAIYWLCPACRKWSTIKPIKDFDHQKQVQKLDNDSFS